MTSGIYPRSSPKERFWSKVEKTDSCWIWKGWKMYKGYGMLDIGEKKVRAHRFAYELLVGNIPDGLTIDHLCRNRACVNPSHMDVVTTKENIIRGESLPALNARKTHCKNGHEFTDENTYHRPNNKRVCRICEREYTRNWRLKNR